MNPPQLAPGRWTWILGLVDLAIAGVLVAIATVGTDHVLRGLLFGGLMVGWLGLLAVRAPFVRRRADAASALDPQATPGSPLPGILLAFLPAAISGAFVATDPAPPLETIWFVFTAVTIWFGLTAVRTQMRARQTRLGVGDPPRLPKLVRVIWALVPGAVMLAWSLTAPGSSTTSCESSEGGQATCFHGPLAMSIPAGMALLTGLIVALAFTGSKPLVGIGDGGSTPVPPSPLSPSSRAAAGAMDAQLARLSELGRLRASGVLDQAEFDRLKAEVLEGVDQGAPGSVGVAGAVVLTAVGPNKIAVIAALRSITGWGLAETKALVDAAERQPVTLAQVPPDQAAAWKANLEAAGASVEA